MKLFYKFLKISIFSISLLLIFSCQNQNLNITTDAILMDEHYDSLPCDGAKAVLAPYKKINDSIMNVVVGQTAIEMTKDFPQGLISNFSADMLFLSAKLFLHQTVDFSLFNLGGIRGEMPKGDVTKGDLYSIYSFDNKIVILDIQGKYLRELFRFFANTEVQAIGGNIQLIFKDKNTLKEALINNKPLEDNKIYKLITVDFIAAGGDGMTMLQNAEKTQTFDLTLRDAIMNIFERNQKKGTLATSKIDNRIIIENQ